MAQSIAHLFNLPKDTFFLISGPCAVESYDICARVCDHMMTITSRLSIPYIFKASYKKANRTKHGSFSGIGDDKALAILDKIKQTYDVLVTTDVHETVEVGAVADVVDLIQIPAFLSRQTDLILAAADSGKAINIKKGQFMDGRSLGHAMDKALTTGNRHVMGTERGNSFGYGDLVVDFRNIALLSTAYTMVMDCSHATQRPNQQTGVSGGNPKEIGLFAQLGLTAGARGLFIETHPEPAAALSDSSAMLALAKMDQLLSGLRPYSQSIDQRL